ncbi:uncharacterized protein [Paramormyrops kingsleyae]|uniref:uncharacterized protein n=1 Tax=Paramormyrops kingsleyae TaxID=1676925 RepID=UPI003B9755BC
MVCTGVLTGLLLFSLSSSVVSADRVDLETLHEIIQVFESRYKPSERTDSGDGAQYAVAIKVPAEQCMENFDEKFLSYEDTDTVRNDLNDETKRLYKGKKMVAARPKGTGSTAIHSERALLICEDSSQAVTPVRDLLNKGDENDCVVFYTYNSPCLDYCLNQKNDNDQQNRERAQKKRGKTNVTPAVKKCILDSLSILTDHPGPKAFVFSQVYRKDRKNTKLASALKEVAEKVPLYRCNTNSCIECLDNNNNFNNQCLS